MYSKSSQIMKNLHGTIASCYAVQLRVDNAKKVVKREAPASDGMYRQREGLSIFPENRGEFPGRASKSNEGRQAYRRQQTIAEIPHSKPVKKERLRRGIKGGEKRLKRGLQVKQNWARLSKNTRQTGHYLPLGIVALSPYHGRGRDTKGPKQRSKKKCLSSVRLYAITSDQG